jgi:hypothetical protein
MVAQRYPRVAVVRLAGQHPLRRRVDSVEAAVLCALVALFLLAAPLLAVAAGRAADAAALRQQRSEAGWTQVTAVLQQGAAAGLTGQGGEWGAAFVTARWPVPGGGQRTGKVTVPLNARAGQRMPEWITGTGQLTRPPLTRADVQDRIASAAVTAMAGLAVGLGLAALAVRVAAGRRRLAGWARAWAAADPRCAPRR